VSGAIRCMTWAKINCAFASVTATSSGNVPTGTVNFLSGQTHVGTGVLSGSQVSPGVVVGTAILATNQIPTGQNIITAQYSGDTNFQGSTSQAISVNFGAGFAIAANPTTIAITSPGQSGSTMLTFTAQNGFAGSTALTPSLCSHLPSESVCSFSPSTVAFTSSMTTVPVTLTVGTQAASGLALSARPFEPGSWVRARQMALVWLIGMCLLLFTRQGPWRLRPVLALIVLAVITSSTGCGGGGGGPAPPPLNPGTPVGNYSGVTVTVTIGGVTQSINNLSVNVQ